MHPAVGPRVRGGVGDFQITMDEAGGDWAQGSCGPRGEGGKASEGQSLHLSRRQGVPSECEGRGTRTPVRCCGLCFSLKGSRCAESLFLETGLPRQPLFAPPPLPPAWHPCGPGRGGTCPLAPPAFHLEGSWASSETVRAPEGLFVFFFHWES